MQFSLIKINETNYVSHDSISGVKFMNPLFNPFCCAFTAFLSCEKKFFDVPLDFT